MIVVAPAGEEDLRAVDGDARAHDIDERPAAVEWFVPRQRVDGAARRQQAESAFARLPHGFAGIDVAVRGAALTPGPSPRGRGEEFGSGRLEARCISAGRE